jgi:hypothetical protein
MKLLVDTKAERVLYAEAGKDVVDFLFSFLALPIGTAVKLLGKESMVGCVGNVYASVEALDDNYVEPGATKDALLRPTMPSAAVGTKHSLFSLPAQPTPVDHQLSQRSSSGAAGCTTVLTPHRFAVMVVMVKAVRVTT